MSNCYLFSDASVFLSSVFFIFVLFYINLCVIISFYFTYWVECYYCQTDNSNLLQVFCFVNTGNDLTVIWLYFQIFLLIYQLTRKCQSYNFADFFPNFLIYFKQWLSADDKVCVFCFLEVIATSTHLWTPDKLINNDLIFYYLCIQWKTCCYFCHNQTHEIVIFSWYLDHLLRLNFWRNETPFVEFQNHRISKVPCSFLSYHTQQKVLLRGYGRWSVFIAVFKDAVPPYIRLDLLMSVILLIIYMS